MILYIKVLNKQQKKSESELHVQCSYPLLTLARASAATGYFSWSVGRSIGWSVYPHFFSRTVAVVDTKRGYVQLAQQESGAALSKNSMFTTGA